MGWQDSFVADATAPKPTGWQSSFVPDLNVQQSEGNLGSNGVGTAPNPAPQDTNISINQQMTPPQAMYDYFQDKPGNEYSDILPLSHNVKSDSYRLDFPEAIRSPARGLAELLSQAGGEIPAQTESSDRPIGAISSDAINALTLGSPVSPASHAVAFGQKLANGIENIGQVASDTLPNAFVDEYTRTQQPEATAPMSSDDIKNIASTHFAHADELGATIPAEKTSQLFSQIAGPAPTTPAQVVLNKRSPVTQFLSDFETANNGPLTLSDAEGMYRDLGDRIDSVGLKDNGNYNSAGLALSNAQNQIRGFLKNSITSGDVGGGATGYEAWSAGQKAWQQAMKAQDLERIQARAQLSTNPTTAYQTGVRNLLLNNKKINLYSPDEVDALQASMKTGIGQDALNVFGSKLLPLGASMVGEAGGGPLGAAISGGIAHIGSTMSRNAASNMKAKQFAQALGQVSSNVPPVSENAAQAYARLLRGGQ